MTDGMPTISGGDWISRNSMRSYPIAEWAKPALANGDPLPYSVLADAMVVVAMEPAVVEISCVSFLPGSVCVELSCGGVSIGSATAALGGVDEGERAEINSLEGRCSGWLVFGSSVAKGGTDLVSVRGVHVLSGCALESRCLVFSGPPALESITGWDGDSPPISGDAQIRLSSGFVVSTSRDEDAGAVDVEVGLASPHDFLPDCLPPFGDLPCSCPGAVRTINGVPGDETGNVRVVVISPPGAPQGSVWTHPTRNGVSVLATIPRKFICEESPVVPDVYGRIGPDFSSDCPPARNYGLDYSGPDCDNPSPAVPAPVEPTS